MIRVEDGLRNALVAIENPGSFAVRREVPCADLRLDVKGVGPITFPISPTKARALCSIALLAHHGFKDQTLLDRRVRDTWEVPKSRLKIDQRRWNNTLIPELERIGRELGLAAGSKLRAELHNLLVYAPGQFFVPHQDSEKEDGMIGTLVVTLPSAFSGGSIIVKHHDQKVEHRGAGRNLGLLAFYADCHHEVRPVQDGYRVVLTYNLLLSHAGDLVCSASAPELDALEASVREFFESPRPARWEGAGTEPPPDRLVYLLDHQYTRKGLTWNQLKNGDAVRVAALRNAAERLDCEVALALADVHETWSCEEEEYGYGSSWRGRRRYDDAGDESPFSDDSTDRKLLELQNSEVELRHFVDAQGKAGAAAGHVPSAELCYTKPSQDLDPFRSEHEGYMGNWGNTVDRWYHRAAVVLWPRERTFVIRARTSATYALDELKKSARREGVDSARRKAAQIAPFWGGVWQQANDSRLVEKALRVALELNSRELALNLATPLKLEQLTPSVVPVVVLLLESYGLAWFDQVLDAWESGPGHHDDGKRVAWLASIDDLAAALGASGSTHAKKLSHRLVREQWAWLSTRCTEAALSPPSSILKTLFQLAKPLLALLRSSTRVDGKLHKKMQDFLTSGTYPILALTQLLETARRTFDARELEALGLDGMAAHCASELEKRLATPVRSPDDWSITPPGDCSCELCAQLSQYLVARDRTTLEWPLAKDRRAHVHHLLDRHELPVTHTTRRSGRPFVLVLTKTHALFEREAAERAAWQRGLGALTGKEPSPRKRSAGRQPRGNSSSQRASRKRLDAGPE